MLTVATYLAGRAPPEQQLEFGMDATAAVCMLERSIDEQANVRAMYTLALLCTGNFPFRPDANRAVALLERCIAEGYTQPAMFDLAEILRTGLFDAAADEARAVQLYQLCIDQQDDVPAMLRLASLLLSPTVISRDHFRAVRLYETCVDRDCYEAMFLLAGILQTGIFGVPRDVQRALQLYQRCIEEDANCQAMITAAQLLLSDLAPARDVDHAVQLCQTCVDNSQFGAFEVAKLASGLANGLGHVPLDIPLAIRLCEMCIDRWNIPFALHVLGKIHLSAPHHLYDVDRGMQLLENYIEQTSNSHDTVHFARSLVNRNSYLDGDWQLAVRIYQVCIDKANNSLATISLAHMLIAQPAHSGKDLSRAFQLCESSIENNSDSDCDDVVDLANILVKGNGFMAKDVQFAMRLYELCIEKQNDIDAMFALARLVASAEPSITADEARLLGLCETILDKTGYAGRVTTLARDIAVVTQYGLPLPMQTNVPLAAKIYQLCIEKVEDCQSMIALATLLVERRQALERDDTRVEKLCEQYIDVADNCEEVTDLANNLHYGTSEIEANVPLSMRLFQLCIDKKKHAQAMLHLAEILVRGVENVERDTDRAAQLFQQCVDEQNDCDDVLDLVRDIALGIGGIQQDAALAVQLCEMCIERKNDPYAMIVLAELIATPIPGVERDIDRVLKLSRSSINGTSDCQRVLFFARRTASGTAGVEKDVRLAIQLYEMCIETWNHPKAMICLARMFAAGAPDVAKDAGRVLDLCESYISEYRSCASVTSLARKLSRGSSGMTKDVSLAIKLYQLCIDKENDQGAMFGLVTVLVSENSSETDRIVQLCERYIDANRNSNCLRVLLRLVRELTCGSSRMKKNAALASRIYERCIDGTNDQGVICEYARTLLNKRTGGEEHVGRVEEMCGNLFEWNFNCDFIVDLGREIASGCGVIAQNVPLAKRLCEKSIEKRNSVYSKLCLAYVLLFEEAERDMGRVIALCESYLNSNGVLRKALRLAKLLATGGCTMKKDVAGAIELCEMCLKVRCFDASSAMMLGHILLTKEDMDDADEKRGMELCARYIQCTGDISTVIQLGKRIASGISTARRNLVLARKLTQMCMDKANNIDAMIAVAEISLTRSEDIDRDVNRAVQLCERHIDETGRCESVISLARRIGDGVYTVERDVSLAIRLCKMCIAKRNHPDAMLLCAEYMLCGSGETEKDVAGGMAYLERYIQQEMNCEAVINLATDLASGTDDVLRDDAVALQICELCMARKHVDAMLLAASILVGGMGVVKRDEDGAMALCARIVDADAGERLADLAAALTTGSPLVRRDVALAVRVYEMQLRACSRARSLFALADILGADAGVDGERDVARAADLYRRAVDHECSSDRSSYFRRSSTSWESSSDDEDASVCLVSDSLSD